MADKQKVEQIVALGFNFPGADIETALILSNNDINRAVELLLSGMTLQPPAEQQPQQQLQQNQESVFAQVEQLAQNILQNSPLMQNYKMV